MIHTKSNTWLRLIYLKNTLPCDLFPNSGPDGIFTQQLVKFTAFGLDDNIGQHLYDLHNLFSKGAPPEMNEVIYAVNQIAPSMKDGNIRPIALFSLRWKFLKILWLFFLI